MGQCIKEYNLDLKGLQRGGIRFQEKGCQGNYKAG